MLSTSEACVYLGGISRKTYQGYIKQGQIKAEMVGGRWMVDKAELNRFMQVRAGVLEKTASPERREAIIKEVLSLEHVKPEHRPLVEDYAQECVNLEGARTQRERSEILARKLKLADALLLTPRSLSRMQELSQELELARSLNDIFVLALEEDQEIGPLYRKRSSSIATTISKMSKCFMDSGLDFSTWLAQYRRNRPG